MAVFIVLLTLLQVSSALYGPRLLTGEVGGSVTIKCFYSPMKANRHDRKYWCKISGARRVCNTIISTNNFISKDYKDRASITDFPKNCTFAVQVTQLEQNDAGAYRCGIGSNNKALFVSMNLTVLEGPNVPKSPEFVLGELRGSVTIQCQPENVKGGEKKFWCKLGKTGCSVIADSDGYVARNYEGRISITPEESSGTFKILINRLKKEDSGLYKCGMAMLGDSGSARTIDLQVTEESKVPRRLSILNGAEGSFVSAKCHYDPQRNYEMKYWCSWKEAGCSLVADTNGFVQDAFEGRIQIISDNQKNGTFTVVMSHLEEKDAGWYWCGAKDGDREQTSSMKLYVQKAPVPSASVSPASPTSVSPASPTSALHSIPSHVNVINQTYPVSRVTEAILEKTTPEDRFVTFSNAVYDSSSTSELQLLPVVMPVLIVLLLLVAIIILVFIKVKLQKKKEMNRSSVRHLEATVTLSDMKYSEEQMEENMDPPKQCEPELGHDKEHSSRLLKDPGGPDEISKFF
ncbi:polymeric immunoglobulin receptor-like isoform 2-T3 [Macrochelys suwanniensis]